LYERFMRQKKNRLFNYLKKKKLEKPKSVLSFFFNF
jgi:ribosomal protein S15P/S13E